MARHLLDRDRVREKARDGRCCTRAYLWKISGPLDRSARALQELYQCCSGLLLITLPTPMGACFRHPSSCGTDSGFQALSNLANTAQEECQSNSCSTQSTLSAMPDRERPCGCIRRRDQVSELRRYPCRKGNIAFSELGKIRRLSDLAFCWGKSTSNACKVHGKRLLGVARRTRSVSASINLRVDFILLTMLQRNLVYRGWLTESL